MELIVAWLSNKWSLNLPHWTANWSQKFIERDKMTLQGHQMWWIDVYLSQGNDSPSSDWTHHFNCEWDEFVRGWNRVFSYFFSLSPPLLQYYPPRSLQTGTKGQAALDTLDEPTMRLCLKHFWFHWRCILWIGTYFEGTGSCLCQQVNICRWALQVQSATIICSWPSPIYSLCSTSC